MAARSKFSRLGIFSKLPAEIRAQIWSEALSIPEEAQPVHLHVYDDLIDGCTYTDVATRRGCWPQGKISRRALLLSCRHIYDEAYKTLIEQTKFELVLCGGCARGKDDEKFYGNRYGKSLGLFERCATLRHVQHMTLVIQPGACESTLR